MSALPPLYLDAASGHGREELLAVAQELSVLTDARQIALERETVRRQEAEHEVLAVTSELGRARETITALRSRLDNVTAQTRHLDALLWEARRVQVPGAMQSHEACHAQILEEHLQSVRWKDATLALFRSQAWWFGETRETAEGTVATCAGCGKRALVGKPGSCGTETCGVYLLSQRLLTWRDELPAVDVLTSAMHAQQGYLAARENDRELVAQLFSLLVHVGFVQERAMTDRSGRTERVCIACDGPEGDDKMIAHAPDCRIVRAVARIRERHLPPEEAPPPAPETPAP